ncbi:MAG: hypothetical protein HYZ84_04645 [Candidatus Omnitrophica bacterium]|nr:hypothetical protein [Candidatus Omnitrophota bacterium]
MRFLKISLFGLFLFVVFGFFLWAENPPAGKPSAELITQGRGLFNQKEGLKVKFACILCHKQEKAIAKSELKKIGDNLPAIINQYITEKSKGQAISEDSQEMKALMAYIRYEHSK